MAGQAEYGPARRDLGYLPGCRKGGPPRGELLQTIRGGDGADALHGVAQGLGVHSVAASTPGQGLEGGGWSFRWAGCELS